MVWFHSHPFTINQPQIQNSPMLTPGESNAHVDLNIPERSSLGKQYLANMENLKTWKAGKLIRLMSGTSFADVVGQVNLQNKQAPRCFRLQTCKCCALISESQTVSVSLIQKTKQIPYHDVKACMTSVHTGKHHLQCEKHPQMITNWNWHSLTQVKVHKDCHL